MTSFERIEAEIEIAYCIASLRQILAAADDSRLLDKIGLGLSTIKRESEGRRRVIRCEMLEKVVALEIGIM